MSIISPTKATTKKVNRTYIYEEIASLIEQSEAKELEISSTELADRFGVQAPTMDYHIAKLVEEGYLAIADQRGKYNRKIYRLTDKKIEEEVSPISEEAIVNFKSFLENHFKESKKQGAAPVKEETKEPTLKEAPVKVTPIPVVAPPAPKKEIDIPVQPLSLDERIQQFLEEANQVHDASLLLKHEDREILSVMNETIHQTNVYLKDLSDQLSMVQNKSLIQHLIDERNEQKKEMDRLTQLVEQYEKQEKKQTESKLDPTRVRFMQQLLISTIDDYVNRPNHAMALGRTEFRNKSTKEIKDLVNYVLGIDK